MIQGLDPRRMARADFIARFSHVFEYSAWISEAAFDAGLPADATTAEGLHRALCAVLRAAPRERKQALIEAHPDLAGRLAERLAGAGRLTSDSIREQSSVGLDRLSDDEHERFTALNAAYREKFGIPFIMAVKGQTKEDILESFRRRIMNDAETEFADALAQIERIALLRLKDILP